jgi:S-sulfo-L-cysteine synthase (O-acetyl-L-serine-dependent)
VHAPDPAPLASITRVAPTSVDAYSGADALIAQIGHTPLLRLTRGLSLRRAITLWGKAEFLNPSGSVKDRAAWAIVERAIADGALRSGRVLLDASSGNTGISYGMLGARLGFSVEICLPRNASPERIRRLKAYGVHLVLTDPLEGTDGAQREARRRAHGHPGRYFYPDQYNHPANPEAHFLGTGPEIWAQTRGAITHLVAGVGTGGTISGAGRYLKQRNSSIQVIGVEPDAPLHGIEGLKHLPTALRPGTYDASVIDGTIRMPTERAQESTRRLARDEGLLVGTSSGAAVAAAEDIARSATAPACIVAVLPDGGDRYFSDAYWENP